MSNNFTGLNNSEQTNMALERINDVAAHMLSQYSDFNNSARNASDIIESIYSNMESVAQYFSQTFSARGIPSAVNRCYCKRDEEIQTVLLSVLWEKVGFTMYLNDLPQALHRKDGKKVVCHRILATRGDCIKIIRENPDNYKQKLLEAEIASLFVPADKNDICEMRVRYLSNEIHAVNQQIAAKEFFLKVLEYTCGRIHLHEEKEFPSMIY